jgi:glycosyltransferase involved in cell wall biosynthesis
LNKLGFADGQVRQVNGGDSILANYYRGAEAFVYPSLYEGFGIPPLEAMACMCPVVASNSSSMPEVIGDAGEFFNPYDQDDMTNAIERVVYSDERKESLKKSGIRRLSYFSWDKCALETLAIYSQM